MKHSVTSFINLIALITIQFFLSGRVQSAVLIVQDGDVAADHYTFSLTGGNLSSYSAGSNAPGLTANNDFIHYFDSPDNYLWASTTTNAADITFGWDFSSSSYRPTSVDLYNVVVIFSPPGVVTLSTSTDNINFTPYRTVSNAQFAFAGTDTISIAPDTTAFYFRVSATTPDPAFGYLQDQWGRASSANTAFSANFTLKSVPEPGVGSLFLLAFGTMLVTTRFRASRKSPAVPI